MGALLPACSGTSCLSKASNPVTTWRNATPSHRPGIMRNANCILVRTGRTRLLEQSKAMLVDFCYTLERCLWYLSSQFQNHGSLHLVSAFRSTWLCVSHQPSHSLGEELSLTVPLQKGRKRRNELRHNHSIPMVEFKTSTRGYNLRKASNDVTYDCCIACILI